MRNIWEMGMARDIPIITVVLLILLALVVLPVYAQDDGEPNPITDDQVNEVSGKLYCPVCEGITLEDCPTVTCSDWREEIRGQLASGMTEEEIIEHFVERFGEKVVGTPQDPTLRAVTLVTPWAATVLAIVVGLWTFMRWRSNQDTEVEFALPIETSPLDGESVDEDKYRKRLETDLRAKR